MNKVSKLRKRFIEKKAIIDIEKKVKMFSVNGEIMQQREIDSVEMRLYIFTRFVYAPVIVFANNALYVMLKEDGSNGVGALSFYDLSSSSLTGECILNVFALLSLLV